MSSRALLASVIDCAFSSGSEPALQRAIGRVAKRNGYDSFAYLSLRAATTQNFAISNYAAEWQSLYFDRSYMIVDPIITMGKRLMQIFRWSVDAERKFANADQRGFWDEASDFGIRSGLTIPITTGYGQVAMLTFATSSKAPLHDIAASDIALAATAVAFLHQRFRNSPHPTMMRKPGLTDREAVFVRWASTGMPMHEISSITGYSFHTVRFDLDNVRVKLGVRNLQEALCVAMAMRLV
ncbi:autoinducer binding domain-containing protein [Rhizobium sp. 2MFCol3.1]|uniref:autoinducer binding domain-containing protein n=1 Tax=Rhizobium sp. 2MFCol3.1 TaxID=1246459 RepID=UPI00036A694B|nr:autoinducer binding domain-containing protein [Rhizobium sp. 2MFCol3.1]